MWCFKKKFDLEDFLPIELLEIIAEYDDGNDLFEDIANMKISANKMTKLKIIKVDMIHVHNHRKVFTRFDYRNAFYMEKHFILINEIPMEYKKKIVMNFLEEVHYSIKKKRGRNSTKPSYINISDYMIDVYKLYPKEKVYEAHLSYFEYGDWLDCHIKVLDIPHAFLEEIMRQFIYRIKNEF